MEKIKVFVNEARCATVICQGCGNSKRIDFQDREIPRSGIAKCKCGNTFSMLFEKRRYYRKQINVNGTCIASEETEYGDPVQLIDVSQGGIAFSKKRGRPLQLNEKVRIAFMLNGNNVSCIASVCNVLNERVGAKFISMDDHSRKALGFFLLP